MLELSVVSPIPPERGLTSILKLLPSWIPSTGSTLEELLPIDAVTPACFNLRSISSLSLSLSEDLTVITVLFDELFLVLISC